ncbi:hypothetical protein [Nonomuraea sp. NPDC049725]|uniref:hypothetical protein n=1 Tax=Nonomuraea sp. NPDC049725 TaxID=3154508 RepID=UPI003421613C
MKFKDGYWRMRPGTRGAYAHAAHDVTAGGGTHPGVRVTAGGDTDQIEIVLTTEE